MTKHAPVLAALLTAVLSVRPLDITGEWTVTATLPAAGAGKGSRQQRIELVCTFEQHDAGLTGSCRPPGGPEGAPLTGTADGTRVEWSFDIAPNDTAAKQPARFRGTVRSDGSAMKGAIEFAESRGGFQARRR